MASLLDVFTMFTNYHLCTFEEFTNDIIPQDMNILAEKHLGAI